MRLRNAIHAGATVLLACGLAGAKGTPQTHWASSILAGTAEQYHAACQASITKSKDELAKFKSAKGPRDAAATIQQWDNVLLWASDASSRSGLAQVVEPTTDMREAAEKCEQDANSFLTDLSLDKAAYEVLLSLDTSKLDPTTQYYMKTTLRDFRRGGVDKDDTTRAKIKQMNEDLLKTGQEFDRNIAGDVRTIEIDPSELDGLPQDLINAHKPNASGKVVLKTDNTDYTPFMTYAKSTKAREAFYRAYRSRAYPKNIEVLDKLMEQRYELATVLGYPDWAQFVTENKMIGSEKNASDFIEKIAAASDARSKRDYEELLGYKKKGDPTATAVFPWENAYLIDKVQQEKYGFNAQAVRPYFEYSRVKQGVMDITSKLYGITYKRAADAKVWHPDVEAWDVLDNKSKKLIGRVYFDMFPRADKFKHYATFALANGKEGVQLPESVLVCNFPQGQKGEPGLMEHGDVVVFFHEYGHLMHGIFSGHTKLVGGNLEWDFIEAPSQMFEEWAWDPAVLQTFANNYKTGEALPVDVAKKMKAADEFGKGLGVRQQMFYAAMSLNYYNRNPRGVDTTKLMSQLQERYTPFKYVEGTYQQTSFGHLNGYSATYYTYMWSKVIAKDLASEFKKEGMMNPRVAARYRDDVLAPGASKPAAELVRDFLGRPYSFDAYQEWLNQN